MKTTDDQNELFIVVDKNDNLLGYKTRRECHMDRNLIHRSVGVLIFNNQGKLLLQKRSATKDKYPLKWTISASGHVEKGQSYRQTAERELYEELGVHTVLEHIGIFYYSGSDEQEMAGVFKGMY